MRPSGWAWAHEGFAHAWPLPPARLPHKRVHAPTGRQPDPPARLGRLPPLRCQQPGPPHRTWPPGWRPAARARGAWAPVLRCTCACMRRAPAVCASLACLPGPAMPLLVHASARVGNTTAVRARSGIKGEHMQHQRQHPHPPAPHTCMHPAAGAPPARVHAAAPPQQGGGPAAARA